MRLTIRTKLFASYATMLVLIGGVGAVGLGGLSGLGRAGKSTQEAVNGSIGSVRAAATLRDDFLIIVRKVRDHALSPDAADREQLDRDLIALPRSIHRGRSWSAQPPSGPPANGDWLANPVKFWTQAWA